MDKELLRARNLVNKIIKKFKRSDLEYTIQASISSVHPDKVVYCAQIEAPANGLAPLTWICNSKEELIEKLTLSEKGLNQKAVEKAYIEAEIKRAKEKQGFFEEKLMKLNDES